MLYLDQTVTVQLNLCLFLTIQLDTEYRRDINGILLFIM